MNLLVDLKCPICGTITIVEDGKDQCFCRFCGNSMNVSETKDSIANKIQDYSSVDESLLMATKRAINERAVLTGDKILNVNEIPYTIESLCKDLEFGWSNQVYEAYYDNLCVLAANYFVKQPNPFTVANLSSMIYATKFSIIKSNRMQSMMLSYRDLKVRIDYGGYVFHALKTALSKYPVSRDNKTSDMMCEVTKTRDDWKNEAEKMREMVDNMIKGNFLGMSEEQWEKAIRVSANRYSQLICDPNNEASGKLKRFFGF